MCCDRGDRKSTRLNSSHLVISYAVFCLKKQQSYRHSDRLSLHATDLSDQTTRITPHEAARARILAVAKAKRVANLPDFPLFFYLSAGPPQKPPLSPPAPPPK